MTSSDCTDAQENKQQSTIFVNETVCIVQPCTTSNHEATSLVVPPSEMFATAAVESVIEATNNSIVLSQEHTYPASKWSVHDRF